MNNPHEDTFMRSSGTLVIRLGEPGHKLPGHFRMTLRDEKGPEDRWTLGVGKAAATKFVATSALPSRMRLIPTPNPELAPKLARSGTLLSSQISLALP